MARRLPIERASALVELMKQQLPLLGTVDLYFPMNLLHLAIEELFEFYAEFEPHATKREFLLNYKSAAGELYDTFVFLLSYGKAVNQPPNFAQLRPDLLNGLGARSSAFDTTAEIIGNISTEKDLTTALTWLLSIARNAPVPLVGLEGFEKTIQKVMQNYPATLYDDYCQFSGKKLGGVEAKAKYDHVLAITKMIRRKVGRTLVEADWLPYYWLAVDWQAGQQNVDLVRQHLAGEINDETLRQHTLDISEKAKKAA